jgi:hypothetical protein
LDLRVTSGHPRRANGHPGTRHHVQNQVAREKQLVPDPQIRQTPSIGPGSNGVGVFAEKLRNFADRKNPSHEYGKAITIVESLQQVINAL